MTYAWEYPIFLVRCGSGFAAVEIDGQREESRFALAVFTREKLCEDFVRNVGIEGNQMSLGSDREFAALVAGLKPPFTAVVFDSTPEEDRVNADWQVDITALLEDHLPLARSPWDYPLFVLRELDGYASVKGPATNGNPLVAVAVFTSREHADSFISAAERSAALVELAGPQALSDLLAELPRSVSVVAFNPVADGERRTAKHCVRIADIRAKYLPE
jgi:hypothetical protein